MTKILPKLFSMPEYDAALAEFLYEGVHELMVRKDPVLAKMKLVPATSLATTQNTMPSGETVEHEPIPVETKFTFEFKDVIAGDVSAVAAVMDKAATEALAIIMPRFFEYMGRVCEATGNCVDGQGQPPSHELILDCLEKIDIAFDENGNPRIPTLVVSPELAEALKKLPPPTTEQAKRRDEIIERKRREYFDRRHHRQLH